MEIVGARLGDNVDDTTRGPSVLSREVAAGNAEFLHRIERNGLADLRGKEIDVFRAVQQSIGTSGALTVDRHSSATNDLVRATRSRSGVLVDVTHGLDEIVRIASKSGEIRDTVLIDNFGNRGGL